MSSIYGNNRSRDNDKHIQRANSGARKRNSSPKKRVDTDNKRILITSAVVNAIIMAVFVVFLFIAVSDGSDRAIYAKYVIIPIAAFVGAFISVLLNKDLVINLAAGAAISLLTFFIFVDFSFMAFLWLLFYLLSAVIGIIAAYIAKTFH